jgi:hypothetical protein
VSGRRLVAADVSRPNRTISLGFRLGDYWFRTRGNDVRDEAKMLFKYLIDLSYPV